MTTKIASKRTQLDGSTADVTKLGRPKGSVNKASALAREAVGRLVENNLDKMEQWLQEIYEQNGPKVAMFVMIDLLEFHLPKLARTEITGLDGGAVRIVAAKEDQDL